MVTSKKLAPPEEFAIVRRPITDKELEQRAIFYPAMNPRAFAKMYGDLFAPVRINVERRLHDVQVNR